MINIFYYDYRKVFSSLGDAYENCWFGHKKICSSFPLIAELLGINPSFISELIGKKIADGMVVRVKGEKDKRIFGISLTEKGCAKAEEMNES